MTFARNAKRMHGPPAVEGGPTLERPAFVLLMMVAEHGPTRLSTLADAVYSDLSTVSRQLAALEAAGWTERERDPDDRRAFLVRITEDGRHVLDCNLQARRGLMRELFADWSETDRLELARLLGQLNKSLDESQATRAVAGA